MPAKPKHALGSVSAAKKTLEDAFGAEDSLALIVAADCGAAVAMTFDGRERPRVRRPGIDILVERGRGEVRGDRVQFIGA